jgi:hypothetical protein
VQDRGAVAFVRAGTLELDGNTITNTESTAVRVAVVVAVVTRAVAESQSGPAEEG